MVPSKPLCHSINRPTVRHSPPLGLREQDDPFLLPNHTHLKSLSESQWTKASAEWSWMNFLWKMTSKQIPQRIYKLTTTELFSSGLYTHSPLCSLTFSNQQLNTVNNVHSNIVHPCSPPAECLDLPLYTKENDPERRNMAHLLCGYLN